MIINRCFDRVNPFPDFRFFLFSLTNERSTEHQPDYLVMAGDVEVGGGWNKKGQASGKDYISISIAAPEFGDRTIYANLG